MSGQHMIDELAASSRRWSKIYALSRSSPVFDAASNIQHLPTDLSAEPETIAEILTKNDVQVYVVVRINRWEWSSLSLDCRDYIFFFAFLKLDPAYVKTEGNSKSDNATKLCAVNGTSIKGSYIDRLLMQLDRTAS